MKSTTLMLITACALVLCAPFASAQPLVYVVTASQQFGTVDLATGTFHPIGAPTPEPQANLVWSNGSLLSLTASGNLVKMNPATGAVTVIGQTGLGFNAFDLAGVNGKLYATDFSNNIYSVDPGTGVATFLRATGAPPDPTIPFTTNSDGTFNLCDESFYGVGGKLYATFDSFAIDPNTLAITNNVNPALYQIDAMTGAAIMVGPTDLQLGASVAVNGTFYAFRLVITGFVDGFPQGFSQLVTLDLKTGKTTFVRNIDPAAGPIFGVAPAPTGRW